MGYSYAAKAGYVLDELMIQVQISPSKTGTSNGWSYQDREYFFEYGRENNDGAITGIVWEILSGGNRCRRTGSARIEPDGRITRFPTSNKTQRQSAITTGLIKFHEVHGGHWQDDKTLSELIGDAKFVVI